MKRTVRCGRVVEIDKYFAPRYGKRAARGDVREATPEDVVRNLCIIDQNII